MSSLSRELRNDLAKVTQAARSRAEDAARAALENLAVHERQARTHMDEAKKKLRANLRARGKALGDARQLDGTQELTRLVEHTAYEHWHRLLFTRFLTENHLLLMPDEAGGAPTPVTVAECEELSSEMGAKDGFDLACRFAGRTLPGVFRADDPVLDLTFAPEGQVALRKLLDSLPGSVFTAADALGWTYQFWQAQRKDDVNKSGVKIGAAEISPVTQLFTEDYMVEFLLHNTLGAWWAGRRLKAEGGRLNGETEADARRLVSLPEKDGIPGIDWTYLRFVRDDVSPNSVQPSGFSLQPSWRPAAGTFDGWPRAVAAIRMLDPCMGSGHFLVFALPLFVRLRMEEEGLDATAAIAAVLRDNIHGLELDERCTQIAAFNLALTAWKLAGYQPLPALHLACSGLAPNTTEAEWVALAGDSEKLQRGMARLYTLFKDAPVLGSLINPRAGEGDLLVAAFHELQPLLEQALARAVRDDNARETTVIASGLAKAAEILASKFTVIATNFPYLKRANQTEELKRFATNLDESAHAELATIFLVKALGDLEENGTLAVVTPQSITYQRYYIHLRKSLLEETCLRLVVKLGPRAFETITGEIVQPALLIIDNRKPVVSDRLGYADYVREVNCLTKNAALKSGELNSLDQKALLNSREYKISSAVVSEHSDLSEYCDCFQGICTGDILRFGACFWELPKEGDGWVLQHSTPENGADVSGCTQVLFWEDGDGTLRKQVVERLGESGVSSWIRGLEAWGAQGVAIAQMQSLRAGLYTGACFDNNTAVIMPRKAQNYVAVFTYCRSDEYRGAVQEIDQSIKISNKTLLKVPFDLAHWQTIADEMYPDGLPKPYSSDPTQWLFNGHPKGSDQPLHVAVARLLGYRWPRQTGSSFPDCAALEADGLESFADGDGIVCLPPVNREGPAAGRLRHLLTAALGTFDERALLAAAGPKGSKSKTLEDWLRDEFFEQHSSHFHDRPFIWHLWDGLKDGFNVLVNYHRLDNATLQKLTYRDLGEWIRQQADDAKADKPGAAARLGAAQALQQKLAAILEGEAPLDVFVRWKPLSEQPLGWNPDLNDGVRQNIRPFLLAGDVGKKGAGLFRVCPLDLKDKDRGNEPERPKKAFPWFWCAEEPGTDPKGGPEFVGTRWNQVHLTLATKRAARGERCK
jgi:hypothetical protein